VKDMELTNEEKYLKALMDIENHIRSTPEPIQYIVKTLLETLSEHQVNEEDIQDWI
jgi:hypothetical protein